MRCSRNYSEFHSLPIRDHCQGFGDIDSIRNVRYGMDISEVFEIQHPLFGYLCFSSNFLG